MAKITRKTQKLFGTSGPSSDFSQFGSLQAGSVIYSQDPAAIQALTAWLQGLTASLITVGSEPSVPVLEETNALFLVAFYQLAYLFQQGIPEYDATTVYYMNSFCQVSGSIYQSIADNNVGHTPSSSPLYWTAPANSAPAGNVYGGLAQNAAIDPVYSFDISACSAKNDAGVYQINAPAITNKSVNSLWNPGSSNGALDAGTIGSSPDVIYIFAVGKSSNSTTGDFLYSKSRTAPDMTRPNAQGFDIKRLVGHRYWTGTQFAQGIASGNGSSRKFNLFNPIKILNAGTSSIFADVDASAYVDGNIAKILDLLGHSSGSGNSIYSYIRPKGSGEAVGPTTFFHSVNTLATSGNEIATQGDIVINTASIFQYAASSVSGSFDIYMRAYSEEL